MKRILAMLISLALIAAMAVGGTIAYLTDDESAVNVMTVGKVDIDLLEHQRGSSNAKLDAYDENNKHLMPAVGDTSATETNWGMPTMENYEDKIVRVKNVGESPAWVRVFYAVPAELDNTGALHITIGTGFIDRENGDSANTYSDDFSAEPAKVGVVELDHTGEKLKYNVYCATMKRALTVGETSAAVIVGAYLDSAVDYDDVEDSFYTGTTKLEYDLDEDIHIPVLAQAVQSEGFETAEQAFTSSFGKISEKLGAWLGGISVENGGDDDDGEEAPGNLAHTYTFEYHPSYILSCNKELVENVDYKYNKFADSLIINTDKPVMISMVPGYDPASLDSLQLELSGTDAKDLTLNNVQIHFQGNRVPLTISGSSNTIRLIGENSLQRTGDLENGQSAIFLNYDSALTIDSSCGGSLTAACDNGYGVGGMGMWGTWDPNPVALKGSAVLNASIMGVEVTAEDSAKHNVP